MKWKMPKMPPRPHPVFTKKKFTLHCDGVKRKIKWRRL